MTKIVNFLQCRKNIFVFLVTTGIVFYLSLPVTRILKRDKEIEGILERTKDLDYCIQYALITTSNGFYPCYNCASGTIYLNSGEVWKYGKTCNGQTGRYPNGMPVPNVKFVVQFQGTEKMCLIEEKRKIYSYPLLPECQKRTIKLLRPPGNKIDR